MCLIAGVDLCQEQLQIRCEDPFDLARAVQRVAEVCEKLDIIMVTAEVAKPAMDA